VSAVAVNDDIGEINRFPAIPLSLEDGRGDRLNPRDGGPAPQLHVGKATNESDIHFCDQVLVARTNNQFGRVAETASDVGGDKPVDREHVGSKKRDKTKRAPGHGRYHMSEAVGSVKKSTAGRTGHAVTKYGKVSQSPEQSEEA